MYGHRMYGPTEVLWLGGRMSCRCNSHLLQVSDRLVLHVALLPGQLQHPLLQFLVPLLLLQSGEEEEEEWRSLE